MPVEFEENGRHFQGRGLGSPGLWKCRSCGTENGTPMEKGCPSCGTGTPEQAEQAKRAPKFVISGERVIKETVNEAYTTEPSDPSPMHTCVLPMLTEKARITVAVALAHFADHGDPNNDQLPRAVIHAWARVIADDLIARPQEK